MPGETDIEVQNGTQEVVAAAEIKQEAPAEIKQVVAEVKQEAADEIKHIVPEIQQEEVTAATEIKQDVVPEIKQDVVPEIKQVVPELKEDVVPEIKKEVVAEVKQVEAPIEPTIQQNGTPKKNTMLTSMDIESVRAAYDDVRSDSTETQWAVFKFQGSRIVTSATGSDFNKFREQFTENERAFGYIRIQTGDEMSKRQKFLFVTWVGSSVSVLQRAKMSTDKSVVKSVISNFAVELQLENGSEIDLDHFVEELNKAGGANYGTGVREI